MGTIYKRNNIWYVDVRVKGKRVRKRVGRSKKIAQLALHDAEVKIAKDEFGFTKNDIALDKFFKRFLEYSRASHRQASTDRYRAVVDHFVVFLKSNGNAVFISEINTEIIDRYKVWRRSSLVNANGQSIDSKDEISKQTRKGARAHTINFELDTLRLIFNLAIRWDYLKENPTKGVTRLKVDDAKPPRFLAVDECQDLLKACPEEQRRIYYTFLITGMRKAELENLQWGDVDFKRCKIRIQRKEDWQPKSGERDIPMNDELMDLLNTIHRDAKKPAKSDYVFHLKDAGRSRNWIREQLIKIAIKAGIEDLTKVHTLRHTFASQLVMSGVDLPTVKKLMGHSDIQTTMIYAHLAADHLADAVNKLSFTSDS